jgi:glycosyltransferase involved in cell wall biosynthesis
VRESRRGGPFPVLFVANNAEGLAPAIRLMRRAGAFEKLILFAHKVPSRRFARAVADIPGHIVCVCGPIADAFRECGVAADVHVDYGIVGAGAFHPAPGGPDAVPAARGRSLRVCLLGDLSSDWKGADTAIAAMSLLPAEYRGRIELHIKAFRDTRDFPRDSGIISHRWSGAGEIPDFLRGMDVMLSVSRNRASDGRLMETFSQTTVQGMLTGLPVVHTSIPPFMEKFDAGGGIRADTPAEIAAALVRLANDHALRARLGREGRTTALARYVWDTAQFCRRYIEG